MKRRNVASTVAKTMVLADQFVKQSAESESQAANDTTPVMLSELESEVVSLLASLEKAREETASANAELDALQAKAELDVREHNVAMAKVREERQDEVKAWKATLSRSGATLAKVRDETSAKIKKLFSIGNSAAARHLEMLAFICRVGESREERRDKAANTLLKVSKIYDECRKVTVKARVAKLSDLREWLASLTNGLGIKILELQANSG